MPRRANDLLRSLLSVQEMNDLKKRLNEISPEIRWTCIEVPRRGDLAEIYAVGPESILHLTIPVALVDHREQFFEFIELVEYALSQQATGDSEQVQEACDRLVELTHKILE